MKNKCKKPLIISLLTLVLLIILIGGFYISTLNFYRAEDNAIQVLAVNIDTIDRRDNIMVFYPEKQMNCNTGLIFYPGGKVENIAYAPLLEKLAQNGITCILVKMPYNLAVFDVNAADSIYNEFPEIKNWFIGGHSLGGAMASSYVEKNTDKLKGLILLGAYPVNNVDIPTLAIYGSEDIKLEKTKLANVDNIVEIVGGNHAYFGDYGDQKGDGKAYISRNEQQAQTVDSIINFINIIRQ